MNPHEHYDDEREGITRRPRRPLQPQQVHALDAAMTHCQLERTLRYHPADLLAAVVRLWADVEDWRDNYRAVHEELEKADQRVADLTELVQKLTLETAIQEPVEGPSPTRVTAPVDGIQIWWSSERGIEVRTILSRVLLCCRSEEAACLCRELLRGSGLPWTAGETTTPEHEAVLRKCLLVEGVTPGRDLALWFQGRLA